MSYLGNKDGPLESDILNRLGNKFFGCTTEALEEDISHHHYAETRGEVVPVHIDEKGRAFVIFSSAGPGKTQRFMLEDHGYILRGDIKTFNEEEAMRWKKRKLAEGSK